MMKNNNSTSTTNNNNNNDQQNKISLERERELLRQSLGGGAFEKVAKI